MSTHSSPDRRKVPVWVQLQGVGKAWVAWVHWAQCRSGRWRKIREDRIRKVQRRKPGRAVVAAILAWRRHKRTCERCGHKWIPRDRTAKRCPGCGNRWRYSRTHPEGIAALERKGLPVNPLRTGGQRQDGGLTDKTGGTE